MEFDSQKSLELCPTLHIMLNLSMLLLQSTRNLVFCEVKVFSSRKLLIENVQINVGGNHEQSRRMLISLKVVAHLQVSISATAPGTCNSKEYLHHPICKIAFKRLSCDAMMLQLADECIQSFCESIMEFVFCSITRAQPLTVA